MFDFNLSKSLFMIFLVLTMPFFSANAFAQVPESYSGVIESIAVYGNQKVHNLIRQNKGIGSSEQIIVDVRIKEANVKQNEVTFNVGSSVFPFESCQNEGAGSKCALSESNTFSPGRYSYSVKYKTTSEFSSFLIDGDAPQIINSMIENIGGGKLKATFDLREGSLQECAGIAKAEISDSSQFSNIVGSKTYSRGEIPCSADDLVIEFNAPSKSGDCDVYLGASDHLGWLSLQPQKVTLNVDIDKPRVDHFELYVGNVKQKSFSEGFKVYTLKIFVDEKNNISSARADLSFYNGPKDSLGVCTKKEADIFHLCEWQNIQIEISPSTSILEFPVSITDSAKNELKESIKKSISVDSDTPELADIRFAFGTGKFVGASNNTLLVDIVDDGVGVDPSKVTADLRPLLSSYSAQSKPSNFSNDTFQWPALKTNAVGDLVITVSAQDYFGKVSSASQTFTVDTAPPEFSVKASADFPSAGITPLTYFIDVKDSSGAEKVVVDSSSISTVSPQQAQCTQNLCNITIENLKTIKFEGNIKITVFDKAGNSKSKDQKVNLLRPDPGSFPSANVVKVKVSDFLPKQIDRKIASQVPLKILLPIKFEYDKKNVRVVRKDQTCDIQQDILSTSNPYILGQESDNSFLYFTVKLDSQTAKLNEIPINCTVNMLVADLATNTLYQEPDVKPLLLADGSLPKIKLYNNPLGSPGDNIIKKLNDIKDNGERWGGKNLIKLEKLFETLRNLCNAIKTLENFYSAVEAIKGPIYGAAQTIERFLPGTGRSLWTYYLSFECTTRVTKESLWPSEKDYEFAGLGDKGALSSFIGGTRKEQSGDPIKIGDYNVGGTIRKVCSFVMCSQCSRGFGFADELANVGGVLPDIGEKAAGGVTSGLIDLPTGKAAVDIEDFYKGSPKDSVAILPRGTGETDESYTRRLEESTRTRQSGEINSKVKPVDLSLMKSTNFEANIDPFNSWPTAVGCFCLPGIIQNMVKYQELQCIYAKCISDHARLGLSIAECEEANRYRQCLYFKGEWWTSVLWMIGVPWAKTMAQKISALITELPGRLVAAFRDAGCKEWDNAVKSSADIDTSKNPLPFNSAKSVGQCWSTSVKEVSLENTVAAGKSIACGLLDAGLLTWSWNNFVDNAFNPDNYKSDKLKSDAGAYCKDAFDLLEQERAPLPVASLSTNSTG